MYHRPVVIPLFSSTLDNYALPICLDILSFNQLMDKVRRNDRVKGYLLKLSCYIFLKIIAL